MLSRDRRARDDPALDAELETSLLQAPQQRVQGCSTSSVAAVSASRSIRTRSSRRWSATGSATSSSAASRASCTAAARSRAGSTSSPRCETTTSAASPRRSRNSGAASRRPLPSARRRRPVAVDDASRHAHVVPTPWGTRGYDDLRIRAQPREPRPRPPPQIASTVDLVRMLEASERPEDAERLQPPPPPDGARARPHPPARPPPRTLRPRFSHVPPPLSTLDSVRDTDASF